MALGISKLQLLELPYGDSSAQSNVMMSSRTNLQLPDLKTAWVLLILLGPLSYVE